MTAIGVGIDQPLTTNASRYREFFAVLLLLVLVFFEPPLLFIERYSLLGFNKAMVLGVTLALAVLLFHKFTITKTAAQLGFFQLLQAALLLVLPFLHMTFGYDLDSGYFSLAFQILAGLALFLIFANGGRINLLARFWVHLHLVIGVCGLLVFVGGIVVNLEPLSTFSDRPYYDFGLAYTNVFYQVGDVKLIRIAGFYDEPGTFAFYMTFALIMAREFGMAKWKESALIVFGLTSLSMAFMIVVAIWLLMAVNKKQVAYAVVVLIGLIFVFGRADQDVRDSVYGATVDRFSIGSSKNRLLKGDDRSAIMMANYDAFLDAPLIGHGLHYDRYVGHRYTWSFIANPMAPLAVHGILGALIVNMHVLLLLLLLVGSKALKKRDRIAILIVLMGTLAQRPTTINGMGYLLFIIMIYRLLEREVLARGSSLARPQFSITSAADGRH